MSKGQTFRNGIDGMHSVGTNWGEVLTVVRKSDLAYGTDKYVVVDRYGRHSYAYGKVAY
jgi:hypothetical protein